MNMKELFDDFNEIQEKKERLQREIKFLDKMKETRLEILRNSVVFDVSVVKAIAKLMSKKENEKYVSFIYNRISHLFTSDNYNVDNYYVGITKYDNVSDLKKGEIINDLLESDEVYSIFLIECDLSEENDEKEKFVSMYDSLSSLKNNVILFKFLFEEYPINGSYPNSKISKCNFEGHEYVKDYIRYLTSLQVQNGGRRLTYNEMNSAIYEFLNMNKEDAKKRIKK